MANFLIKAEQWHTERFETLAETAEICQSQSEEQQQRLCLSVNIQNTSLEVALN